MKIISVINQKGGVGKSTTVQNIAIGLAQKGFKVGLVDLDEQLSNLTYLFFGAKDDFSISLPSILEAIIIDKANIELEDCHFLPTKFENLSILPTRGQIVDYLNKAVINPNEVIKRLLPKTGFDYILIDTPGNMLISTFNGLVASDQFIIVSQPKMLSLVGMNDIVKQINSIKEKLNPKLSILGIILNMTKSNTKSTQTSLKWLQSSPEFKDIMFKSTIPYTEEVETTQNDILSNVVNTFKTIFQKKSSNVGMYYTDLVNEFIHKTK